MKSTIWTLALLSLLLVLGSGARPSMAQSPAVQFGAAGEDPYAIWAEEDEDEAHPFGGALATAKHCDACRRKRRPCACGPQGRFWASAEYLYWWTKGQPIPTLVTTGSPADAIPGALGQPGTRTLLGGSIDGEGYSGGRFSIGFWLNQPQTQGFEASYFFLGSRTDGFAAGGPGTPGSQVIARPFLDVTNPNSRFQNSEIVRFPDGVTGRVAVDSWTSLQGVGANGLCNLCCCSSRCGGRRFDLLGGFNWTQLNQGLSIHEDITLTAPQVAGFPAGTRFNVAEEFSAQNNFYGAQVGIRGWWWRNRFFVNAQGLMAIGATHQQVNISGVTSITPVGGPPVVVPGGLLALPTNMGSFSRDQFSFIPQVGINTGYQVTDHIRLFGGYSFMYWTNVVQPGHSIDPAINVQQIPSSGLADPLTGPARPAPLLRDTDFWAQGLNVGALVQF